MFKKLLEPTIEIKTNCVAFIGITVSSLYGCYYMIVNSIADIKEIIEMFN